MLWVLLVVFGVSAFILGSWRPVRWLLTLLFAVATLVLLVHGQWDGVACGLVFTLLVLPRQRKKS